MLIEKEVILNDFSGKIELYHGFASYLNLHQESFITSLSLQRKPIKIFGKVILQPRLICFYGDEGVEYTYSRSKMISLDWNDQIKRLKDEIENLLKENFNSALVNYYRDGNDSMGYHADDETELGLNPTIASVSFGCSRRMNFVCKRTKEKITIELRHGDLLVMSGALQHQWRHSIPKSKKITEGRLNITYRNIIK